MNEDKKKKWFEVQWFSYFGYSFIKASNFEKALKKARKEEPLFLVQAKKENHRPIVIRTLEHDDKYIKTLEEISKDRKKRAKNIEKFIREEMKK